MSDTSEGVRQLVHVTMGGFALLLRYLTWWQAAIIAALALGFNALVLPNIGGRRLYRAADHSRGFPAGIILYPVSVLVLILVFPSRPDIAAAAWGILAAGDGMGTVVGRSWGTTRVPWNPDKTWAGSTAVFVFGAAAGIGLAWWCRPAVTPQPSMVFVVGATVAAAFVAALVESLPVRLDDNISVPAAAAATMWVLSLVNVDLLPAAWQEASGRLVGAIAVNGVAAWAGYRARTVSVSGALVGAAIGALVILATGWAGWTLLFLTFLAASVSSRLGLARKTLLGIAEERGGRRGAGNAIANTGVAAAAAFLALVSDSRDLALLAFVTALTAGGSDTIASEVGKAWGRRTWLVATLRPAAPGTPGAVSAEGTAAGFLGALVLAFAGVALRLVPAEVMLPIVGGATVGSFAESLLAATLEPQGILNNDLLNFLNTSAAVVSALALAAVMR